MKASQGFMQSKISLNCYKIIKNSNKCLKHFEMKMKVEKLAFDFHALAKCLGVKGGAKPFRKLETLTNW